MKLRVLIADDEPLARERLKQLLDDSVEVVAECGDGASTVATVPSHAPDVLLLDIRMPDMDGFAVLEALHKESRPPWVIFVTGYDQHAVRAFEARALDYLLKPVSRARLHEALDRAREWISRAGPPAEPRIALRDGSRVKFVEISAVDWIEAAGNYALVHAGGFTHIVRETMAALMSRLPDDVFLRVSRSAIVNVGHVRMVQRRDGQNCVVLAEGQYVPVTLPLREIEKRIDEGRAGLR